MQKKSNQQKKINPASTTVLNIKRKAPPPQNSIWNFPQFLTHFKAEIFTQAKKFLISISLSFSALFDGLKKHI